MTSASRLRGSARLILRIRRAKSCVRRLRSLCFSKLIAQHCTRLLHRSTWFVQHFGWSDVPIFRWPDIVTLPSSFSCHPSCWHHWLPLALAFPNPYQSRDGARYSQSDQSPENRFVIVMEEAENFAAIAPGQERQSEVAYSARRAHREHQVASRVVESPCGDGER